MKKESGQQVILHRQELEAVYAISRAVVSTMDMDAALNKIVSLVRPIFIFDNIVIYETSLGASLEPSFAKAIGRGRFHEADAYQSSRVTTRVEEIKSQPDDRTNHRYLLAIPLKLGDRVSGALVFIRFGGPIFTSTQIQLAEFISVHIAQLLEHRRLVKQVAELEAQRILHNLQDDFIAMVSHELLTPLGFIKGYATTMLREDINWDEPTQREFLTIIDEESDRLRELIDNLMDSSRLQAGTLKMNFEPIRLDTFLKDLCLRARSVEPSRDIHLEIQKPGVKVQADPTRLAQVFENLLSNAYKYAPKSPITIGIDCEQDTACISFSDQGPGIPPEHLPKLFQRFYRVPETASQARGTGLGLYICRNIIQAHQGEITLESTPGKGTTFHIYLPGALCS
jgi:signal transduction histidine kinase